jgi:radical SAM protein with 4Fe4S-binding SPASM domain
MLSAKGLPFYSKYQMLVRHVHTVRKHATPKRLANLITNEMEFKMKKPVLRSLPYAAKIEASAFCHLKCAWCSFGQGEGGTHTRDMMMPLDRFKQLIDSLSDSLMIASLSRVGEALLHPDITKMIAYCTEKNIGTEFPTTFSVKMDENRIEELVTGGLDHLIVSIDGTTQDVYETYRKGASLDRVLKNVSMLLKTRERLKSKDPLLEFKFIIFDHNRHQLKDAEKLAGDLGFDKFSTVLDNSSQRTMQHMRDVRESHLSKKQACYWLWNTLIVAWDGTVYPCCNREVVMGNVFETDLRALWNNEKFQKMRRFFKTHEIDDDTRVCFRCMQF